MVTYMKLFLPDSTQITECPKNAMAYLTWCNTLTSLAENTSKGGDGTLGMR